MLRYGRRQAGFTLVELLVVVILLGILAAIAIPRLTSATEDAQVSALRANLGLIREAIEVYHHQHDGMNPGYVRLSNGDLDTKGGAYFVEQLTRYTALDGTTSAIPDSLHRFGPYLKGDALPDNPFKEDGRVVMNHSQTDITARGCSGPRGWKFHSKTGIFYANLVLYRHF